MIYVKRIPQRPGESGWTSVGSPPVLELVPDLPVIPDAGSVPDAPAGSDADVAAPRVVFVGHVARLSGGEIALANLLDAAGDEIDAVVILAEDGPLVPRLRAAGAEVIVLPMPGRLRDARRDRALSSLRGGGIVGLLGYVARLSRLLRQLRPDFVHTNTLKAALYGGLAARLAGIPLVWHIRDRIAPDYLPRATVHLVRAASRVLPDVVIANSQSTLDTLPKGRNRHVVRDVGRDMASVSTATSEAGLAVGIAGRLATWKGQDLFLRAFAQAFAGTDARAVVIGAPLFGEHAFAASLRDLTRELGIAGQTEFRGFRLDMPAEYARLDLLVHCSTVPEPYGLVVSEGMSAGLCVLAADEGGPQEFVTHGVDGVLVPPRSVAALADAMRQWGSADAARAAIGQAARATAVNAGADRSVDALLATYRPDHTSRPRSASADSTPQRQNGKIVA